jgi:hypothetical protein
MYHWPDSRSSHYSESLRYHANREDEVAQAEDDDATKEHDVQTDAHDNSSMDLDNVPFKHFDDVPPKDFDDAPFKDFDNLPPKDFDDVPNKDFDKFPIEYFDECLVMDPDDLSPRTADSVQSNIDNDTDPMNLDEIPSIGAKNVRLTAPDDFFSTESDAGMRSRQSWGSQSRGDSSQSHVSALLPSEADARVSPSFMSLPTEIRMLVYEHVFPGRVFIQVRHVPDCRLEHAQCIWRFNLYEKWRFFPMNESWGLKSQVESNPRLGKIKPISATALLSTCSQVRSEALEYLLKNNATAVFRGTITLVPFLRQFRHLTSYLQRLMLIVRITDESLSARRQFRLETLVQMCRHLKHLTVEALFTPDGFRTSKRGYLNFFRLVISLPLQDAKVDIWQIGLPTITVPHSVPHLSNECKDVLLGRLDRGSGQSGRGRHQRQRQDKLVEKLPQLRQALLSRLVSSTLLTPFARLNISDEYCDSYWSLT